jgi:hypothetical protein
MAMKYVKVLIEKEVSGLCIDTTAHFDSEIIHLADKYNFPLIAVDKNVSFIDICRGLNTIILSNSTKLMQHADYYENELKAANPIDIQSSIEYTAEYLGLYITYISPKGKYYASSLCERSLINFNLPKLLNNSEKNCPGNIAIKAIT